MKNKIKNVFIVIMIMLLFIPVIANAKSNQYVILECEKNPECIKNEIQHFKLKKIGTENDLPKSHTWYEYIYINIFK